MRRRGILGRDRRRYGRAVRRFRHPGQIVVARILGQLGVHHVVRPEHDMGKRVAHLVRARMLDYIEFEDGFAMVKTTPPAAILDRPLGETHIRAGPDGTVMSADELARATATSLHGEFATVVSTAELT
jgi:trk system potassium uptake protein TrkA